MKLFITCVISAIFCSSCVQHRLSIDAPVDNNLHLYKDGMPVESDKLNCSSALPAEMHVDAWYRDQQGRLYRGHQYISSPRPWWQRFPIDIFSDGLWPQELEVHAGKSLKMNPVTPVESSYLDTISTHYGYGSRDRGQQVLQP